VGDPYLIYGANGYTGELISRLAVERGGKPMLAGRNAAALGALAKELGLESRAFELSDPAGVAAGLLGARVVLHCAGPFSRTSRPMADACLRARVHYLDITGEARVFEALAARSDEARAAGVMLLPGAGFDVVPSDCLAAHLKRRLPSATHLSLAFRSQGGVSRGTATTMIENIDKGGLVRRAGRLVQVPAAYKSRRIDFGRGPRLAVTIPWGDVATAYHSTGIPNIEVFTTVSATARLGMIASRALRPLLGSAAVKGFLLSRLDARPAGPSQATRATARAFLWGEVTDGEGRRAVSRLVTPEGYTLTARTALAIVERVLSGAAPAGFQTPSMAYGADFVLGIEGVRREDL